MQKKTGELFFLTTAEEPNSLKATCGEVYSGGYALRWLSGAPTGRAFCNDGTPGSAIAAPGAINSSPHRGIGA